MAQEAKEKLYPVKLLRRYWLAGSYIDEAGLVVDNIAQIGTVVEVPVEEALRLIDRGVAERADPLS